MRKKTTMTKTFGELDSERKGEPLTSLLGKSFEITASELAVTEYNGDPNTPVAKVTVDGKVYYTFSKVLIQQIRDTIQPANQNGEPVTVHLEDKKGKRGTYQTFS